VNSKEAQAFIPLEEMPATGFKLVDVIRSKITKGAAFFVALGHHIKAWPADAKISPVNVRPLFWDPLAKTR